MIFFAKLKERKLVQWALAYLAGAWLLLQLLTILHQNFAWPPLLIRGATVLLAIGFLGTLVLAWYHGEKAEQRVGTMEILMLAGILVIAGVGVSWVRASSGATDGEEAPDPPISPLTTPAPIPEQGSIAVLPFVNMSGDKKNEYFSDGLAEELLNALSQLPELRVAARTSAFAFEDTNVGIDSIARALNVAHVVEGSVRKAGNRVRITAQLIDAGTSYHVWSGTYDAELADIFAVQDSISRAIVQALRIELGGGREGRPLVERETASPEAYTLVLKGWYYVEQSTRESVARAERFYREALALDPEYARAHAGLAASLWYQAYQHSIDPAEGYAEAKREAERALALDPGLSEAHVVLGRVAAEHDWDWEAAELHYRQAIAANPGNARAYDYRALLLAQLGRFDEAIASAERAVALDPVSFGRLNNVGEIYRITGQPERAIERYEAALGLEPGHPLVLANIALTHAVAGRHEEALQSAEAAVEAAPEFGFALSTLAYVQARAGRTAEAREALSRLEALHDLATVHAGLGERDRMFALLQEAVENRDGYVTYLGLDPVFDPYRDDPRMRDLLDRIGLP